jgi:hypothetical protein
MIQLFRHPLPLLLLAAAFPITGALAQQSTTKYNTVAAGQNNIVHDPSTLGDTNPPDAAQSRMVKSMAEQRNALRQKEIVEDSQHLLDLARQLKDAVDKSSKDQLSLDVVNEAAEIEKLAKNVKKRMLEGD